MVVAGATEREEEPEVVACRAVENEDVGHLEEGGSV